jgi:hypothetical protein
VDVLEAQNKTLQSRVLELESRLLFTEAKQDKSNKYSRRNLFHINGVPEKNGEYTDQSYLMSLGQWGRDYH